MSINQQQVRDRAFELWMQRGCPEGSAQEDWLNAEKQLAEIDSVQTPPAAVDESATDRLSVAKPSANHLIDEAPVNIPVEESLAASERRDDRKR